MKENRSPVTENRFKTCNNCKEVKEHTPLGQRCIDCKKEYDRQYRLANLEALKENSMVYRSREERKLLKQEYDRKYRDRNKDRITGNNLKAKINGQERRIAKKVRLNKYGLSPEDYDDLCNKQNLACAICGTTEYLEKGKCLCVDHCHTTGKIRGLLCSHCNSGIGFFKDNIRNLQSAILYLKTS